MCVSRYSSKESADSPPPAVTAGGPYQAAEGGTTPVTAATGEGESREISYAWDLDDNGSFETPGRAVEFSARELDGNSTQTIRVKATAEDGAYAIDEATVQVLNAAPALGTIAAPVSPVAAKTAIEATANFRDPGVSDFHTAVWDWGDGSATAGTVDEAHGSGTLAGSHTYTSPGVYTLKLTVTDDDGASAESLFRHVVVYDPSAGFVTAGGKIHSPAGAYAADRNLTGKAAFAFVSKYEQGATKPSGTTRFSFDVADFLLQSTSYQWLVVSGAKAQFKGVGTLNGGGDYGFLLTAVDGQLSGDGYDSFRIKIWDRASGAIVYDNQPGAADGTEPTTRIVEGNIAIHK